MVLFSSWIPGIRVFFCLFFLFSDVKVDFSHGGPVFFLDSRNFGKSPFFIFFCLFFLFSDVKVDFLTVVLFSSWIPGIRVFFLFFLCFFSVSITFIFCFF